MTKLGSCPLATRARAMNRLINAERSDALIERAGRRGVSLHNIQEAIRLGDEQIITFEPLARLVMPAIGRIDLPTPPLLV